jgi:hypothetical protein
MHLPRWFAVLSTLAFTPLAPGAAAWPSALETIEVDIQKLTSIDWQQGKELPKEIRDLDGREIVISGYMQSQNVRDTDTLLIVSDSCQCTGTPLPHHFVRVKLDKKTSYKPGQLTFIGKLSVGEELEDGFVTSIYRLEGKYL